MLMLTFTEEMHRKTRYLHHAAATYTEEGNGAMEKGTGASGFATWSQSKTDITNRTNYLRSMHGTCTKCLLIELSLPGGSVGRGPDTCLVNDG